MSRACRLLRVGIGGPVGSGKTALTVALCLALRDNDQIAVVANDIYTEEHVQFLVRNQALEAARVLIARSVATWRSGSAVCIAAPR